jgi:hypothetical protein
MRMKKTRTTLQYKNEDKTRYNSKTRTTRTPEKKPEAEKQPEAIVEVICLLIIKLVVCHCQLYLRRIQVHNHRVRFMVFNITFNNISVISWLSEKTIDLSQVTDKLYSVKHHKPTNLICFILGPTVNFVLEEPDFYIAYATASITSDSSNSSNSSFLDTLMRHLRSKYEK